MMTIYDDITKPTDEDREIASGVAFAAATDAPTFEGRLEQRADLTEAIAEKIADAREQASADGFRRGIETAAAWLCKEDYDTLALHMRLICEAADALSAASQPAEPDPRDKRVAELEAAVKPLADLFDRPWEDKAESIAIVERGGYVSELQAVELKHVLAARAALAKE